MTAYIWYVSRVDNISRVQTLLQRSAWFTKQIPVGPILIAGDKVYFVPRPKRTFVIGTKPFGHEVGASPGERGVASLTLQI